MKGDVRCVYCDATVEPTHRAVKAHVVICKKGHLANLKEAVAIALSNPLPASVRLLLTNALSEASRP